MHSRFIPEPPRPIAKINISNKAIDIFRDNKESESGLPKVCMNILLHNVSKGISQMLSTEIDCFHARPRC